MVNRRGVLGSRSDLVNDLTASAGGGHSVSGVWFAGAVKDGSQVIARLACWASLKGQLQGRSVGAWIDTPAEGNRVQCATKGPREDGGSQADNGVFGSLQSGRWFLADDVRPTVGWVARIDTGLFVGGDGGASNVAKAMAGVGLNGRRVDAGLRGASR